PDGEAELDELEKHHLGRIRAAGAELDDPCIAAGAPLVTGRDLLEQLVDRELVIVELREGQPAGVQVASLRQRDQLLEFWPQRLRLGLSGANPLVLDQLLRHGAKQRLSMSRIPAQLGSLALVPHRSRLNSRGLSRRGARGRVPAGSPEPPRSTCDRSSGSR